MSRRASAARAVRDAARRIPTGAVEKGWQPLAAAFHYGTRDVRWRKGAEREAFEDALVRTAAVEPSPSPCKPVTGRGIALPIGPQTGEFAEVLLARRTWRGFGRRRIAKAALGSLLDLSFGAQMAGTARSGGEVLFKTSPSGGARHPVEAYVMVLRVAGVSAGLYHYSPVTRRLYPVGAGATPALAVEYLAGQTWYAGAGAIVFMTAVMPRLWWRYRHPRVYRAALLEAGHVCQTFCLTATWLGLAPFCTMALEDSRIERALGLDGVSEVLLYAAGVGSRPAGGRWVQWPGNQPDIAPSSAAKTAPRPARKKAR